MVSKRAGDKSHLYLALLTTSAQRPFGHTLVSFSVLVTKYSDRAVWGRGFGFAHLSRIGSIVTGRSRQPKGAAHTESTVRKQQRTLTVPLSSFSSVAVQNPSLGNGVTHSGWVFSINIIKVIPYRHAQRSPPRSVQILSSWELTLFIRVQFSSTFLFLYLIY